MNNYLNQSALNSAPRYPQSFYVGGKRVMYKTGKMNKTLLSRAVLAAIYANSKVTENGNGWL